MKKYVNTLKMDPSPTSEKLSNTSMPTFHQTLHLSEFS